MVVFIILNFHGLQKSLIDVAGVITWDQNNIKFKATEEWTKLKIKITQYSSLTRICWNVLKHWDTIL